MKAKGYTITPNGRYHAQVNFKGTTKHLGTYDTPHAARAAWAAFRAKHPSLKSPKGGQNAGLPVGVSRSSSSGRYKASIKIDNRSYHLGTYNTAEEAEAAFAKGKKAREQWKKQQTKARPF